MTNLTDKDIVYLQERLESNARNYLNLIANEYGQFFSDLNSEMLAKLRASSKIIEVDENFDRYFENQKEAIKSDSSLSEPEKEKELSEIKPCLAHGGRVYDDNRIHVYPSFLMQRESKSLEQIYQECNSVLVHELLHFFIRPKYSQDSKVSSLVTEGLVDMCARDIHQKLGINAGYLSNYAENVMIVRKGLGNIQDEREAYNVIFNSSVDDFLRLTSTSEFNSYNEFSKLYFYQKTKDKAEKEQFKSDYRKKMEKLASLFPDYSASQESITRAILNESANYKTENEALLEINKIALKIRMKLDGLSKEQIEDVISRGIESPLDSSYDKYKEQFIKNPSTNLQVSNSDNHISMGFINTTVLIIIVILMILLTSFFVYWIFFS